MTRLLIVELVGPLVDDQGGAEHTLLAVLASRGLVVRDGAADAVAGASAAHAVATLLGGHGREADDQTVARAAAEIERRWAASLLSGEWRPVPGAREAVARLGTVGIISNLPAAAVAAALGDLPHLLPDTDAGRGLPHPDPIVAMAKDAGVVPDMVTAVVHTPSALLAATQAGVRRIVLVGERHGRWTEMLPVTARVASLADLAALAG